MSSLTEITPALADPFAPSQRLDPDMPMALSDAEVEEAASELGLTYFNPKKVRALEKVGAFAAKQHVIHQGVGRLLAVEQVVMEVLSEIAEIAKDGGNLTEERVMAAGQVNSLANTLIRSTELAAEFQQRGLLKPKVTKRVFNDEPIQVNTQVNISVPTAPVKEVDSGGGVPHSDRHVSN